MRIKLAISTAVLFITTLFFVGCSVSTHPGVTTIAKPSQNENTEAVWLNYYQDQFDAYKGAVIAPTSEYPDAAKQAFQRAASEYQNKVVTAANKTQLSWLGGSILVAIIIVLFNTESGVL
jgi:hypothetical protein